MNGVNFQIYYAISAMYLVGFLICLWWWAKIKRVTTVYVTTTLFFAASSIHYLIDAALFGELPEPNAVYSLIWVFRTATHLLVVILLVVQLYIRMLKSYAGIKRNGKKIKYKRVDDYPLR